MGADHFLPSVLQPSLSGVRMFQTSVVSQPDLLRPPHGKVFFPSRVLEIFTFLLLGSFFFLFWFFRRDFGATN